jgi:hypothetical protein
LLSFILFHPCFRVLFQSPLDYGCYLALGGFTPFP